MTDTILQNWEGVLPWKRIDKIEHEETGTCARIEISQDTDKADQKLNLVYENS